MKVKLHNTLNSEICINIQIENTQLTICRLGKKWFTSYKLAPCDYIRLVIHT